MSNVILKSNLLPDDDLERNFGLTSEFWKIYGEIHSKGISTTEDVDYGDTLPIDGEEGQLFFHSYESYTPASQSINFDDIYPVGAIYVSVVSTNPSTFFGGTWTQIQNAFLIGAGNSYAVNSIGGSSTMAHTHQQVAQNTGGPSNNTSGSTGLSAAQMPSHNHGSISLTGTMNQLMMDDGRTISFSGICSGSKPKTASWTGQSGNEVRKVNINATHTHSAQGSGSGHTHTLSSHTHTYSAATTGAASNTDNMPPYLAVYAWQRTA